MTRTECRQARADSRIRAWVSIPVKGGPRPRRNTSRVRVRLALVAGLVLFALPALSGAQTISTYATGAPRLSFNGIATDPAGGTSSVLTFEVAPPVPPPAVPTLASIVPDHGLLGETVQVTITGADLTGASINTTTDIFVTSVTPLSDGEVRAAFVVLGGRGYGPRAISVTTPSGTSGPITFTIVPPPNYATSPALRKFVDPLPDDPERRAGHKDLPGFGLLRDFGP